MYKKTVIIYSHLGFHEKIHAIADGCEVFTHTSATEHSFIDEFPASMTCNIIIPDERLNKNSNNDVKPALDLIFTSIGIDFKIKNTYLLFKLINDNWIELPCETIYHQSIHYIKSAGDSLLDQEIINTIEFFSKQNTAISKKIIRLYKKLRSAIKLQSIDAAYSFLAYYNVIERIADSFLNLEENPRGKFVEQKIKTEIDFKKSRQQDKMKALLWSLRLKSTEALMGLSTKRNKLAHTDENVSIDDLTACKTLAMHAFEEFILFHKRLTSRCT